MAVKARIGGVIETPGDGLGLELNDIGDVDTFELVTETAGEANTEPITVAAPLDCVVSKNGQDYAAQVQFAAGEVTDAGALVHVQRTAINYGVRTTGITTTPHLSAVAVSGGIAVEITAVNGTTVTLEWAGAVADSFQVQYAAAGSGNWITLDAAHPDTSHAFTVPNAETAYDFRARGFTAGTYSGWYATATLQVLSVGVSHVGLQTQDPDWPTTRDQANAEVVTVLPASLDFWGHDRILGGLYCIDRTVLMANTAAIPNAATILEARLYLRAKLIDNAGQIQHVVSTDHAALPDLTGYARAHFGTVSAGSFPANPGVDAYASTAINRAIVPVNVNGNTLMGLRGPLDYNNSDVAPVDYNRTRWHSSSGTPGATPKFVVRYVA